MNSISIIPIPDIPQIHPGDDLTALILDAIDKEKIGVENGDILVLCQKVVS